MSKSFSGIVYQTKPDLLAGIIAEWRSGTRKPFPGDAVAEASALVHFFTESPEDDNWLDALSLTFDEIVDAIQATASMFENRIESAACEFIELDEAEGEIYSGAGLALAIEVEGKLSELVYAGRVDEDGWNATLDRAFDERVWLVRCSTYTLCQPVRMDPENIGEFKNREGLF